MSKLLSLMLALFLFVALPIVAWVWLHNGLVSKEERTKEAWAQVESNFQRRADLIPALVEAVSHYLRHESQTLTSVTKARGDAIAAAVSDLVGAQKDASAILGRHGGSLVDDDSAFAALEAAERNVGGRMSALLAIAEQYPQLRSSDQFLALEAEIEGTENRINVARMRFNAAVAEYNASIRRIPTSAVASVAGFARKAYFRADAGAGSAPALDLR